MCTLISAQLSCFDIFSEMEIHIIFLAVFDVRHHLIPSGVYSANE